MRAYLTYFFPTLTARYLDVHGGVLCGVGCWNIVSRRMGTLDWRESKKLVRSDDWDLIRSRTAGDILLLGRYYVCIYVPIYVSYSPYTSSRGVFAIYIKRPFVFFLTAIVSFLWINTRTHPALLTCGGGGWCTKYLSYVVRGKFMISYTSYT